MTDYIEDFQAKLIGTVYGRIINLNIILLSHYGRIYYT